MVARNTDPLHREDAYPAETAIASWLRTVLDDRAWSVNELSRRLAEHGMRIHANGLRRFLEGRRILTLSEAITIADVLDIGVEQMIREAQARDHEHAMMWGPPTRQPLGGRLRHGRCSTCGRAATEITATSVNWQ